MKEVTDTALLEQLNAAPAGGAEVTDPDILAQLDPDYVDTRIDMDEWQPVPEGEKDFGDRVLAGVSGFADTVTMGMGDETAAGLEAGAQWLGEKAGIGDSGQDFTEMYQQQLGKGQAAREQLATQYPTEFSQGEWTGIGTQMLSPAGVTKAAGTGLAKGKGIADKAIETGATKVKDLVVEPLQGLPKVKGFVEGAVPSSVGDLATMAGGATMSPVSPITGAATALGAKRTVEAGTKNLAGRVAQNKKLAAEAEKLKAHAERTAKIIPEESTAMFGNKSFYTGKAAEATKQVNDIEKLISKDYVGRAAGAVVDLNTKYGPMMKDWASRGGDALTANVFVKQQQDPEFRESLRAAKEEAANEAE